jgi:hypothetical protein
MFVVLPTISVAFIVVSFEAKTLQVLSEPRVRSRGPRPPRSGGFHFVEFVTQSCAMLLPWSTAVFGYSKIMAESHNVRAVFQDTPIVLQSHGNGDHVNLT